MPEIKPFHRPQTLKQAKKAYRKSDSKPKLSASEIAVIERRAVLQERADRIREREARRKANIKRKEERKETERYNMIRMGRSLPVETGIKVGPSQLDLARFLPAVVKDDRNVKETAELQTKLLTQLAEQAEDIHTVPMAIKITNGMSMAPPSPHALKHRSVNTCSRTAVPISGKKSDAIQSEDYDDIFVSNTQIERELSPQVTPPSHHLVTLPTLSPSKSPDLISEDPNDFLARICTQDLDFSGIFTQVPPAADTLSTTSRKLDTAVEKDAEDAQNMTDISTQDIDFEPTQIFPQPRSKTSDSFEVEDGFTDNDLESLALEIELQSSGELTDDMTSKTTSVIRRT